jgi:P4 family phage/plasmid primase-like protien
MSLVLPDCLSFLNTESLDAVIQKNHQQSVPLDDEDDVDDESFKQYLDSLDSAPVVSPAEFIANYKPRDPKDVPQIPVAPKEAPKKAPKRPKKALQPISDEEQVKFYHDTICKMSKHDNVCTNTHRTDFVGYKDGNKAFNVIKTWRHPTSNELCRSGPPVQFLRSLVEDLMKKQGNNFYLNEFPEECKHLQYIDLDADIPDTLLDYITTALFELTTGAEILVLRSTSSRKVHLIMNVPASTFRSSCRKRAIAKWLREYLYQNAVELVENHYTPAEWKNIFDASAPGIRSALSVKVLSGNDIPTRLEPNKGVYAPEGCNVRRLSFQEMVDIVIKYSIYNDPEADWTEETLAAFNEAEEKLKVEEAEEKAANEAKNQDRTVPNDYNEEKKTIKIRGIEYPVNGALINSFIEQLPTTRAEGDTWKKTLWRVKSAAQLADDFDPHYFLHVWSAQDKKGYNKEDNDAKYLKCDVRVEDAGPCLTWLKNRASVKDETVTNLSRGDYGLALIFKELAGNNIKIVSSDGTCYLWDDKSCLWENRDCAWIGNQVSERLEPVFMERITHLENALDKATEESLQKALMTQIKTMQARKEKIMNYRPAMDVVYKARPMLTDVDFITKINLQPDLLPIKGGLVVDLRTGETTPRLQSHNFTFQCPVSIDRDEGRRGMVEKFMLDICCGDEALLRYFQVALGYCITGHINEKAVFVWWGARDNGKSTIMNLMKAILGDYCKSASKCLFIKTKSDSKLTPEKEVLKDTRMVLFSETGADDELDDGVLKMASGDDLITVNPKYQKEYQFKSYAKLLVATNHKPKINVNDEAMVRRVKFIPFLTKFVDNPAGPNERKKDGPLALRLQTDLLDAFFTWVLDGAISWYKTGIVEIPAAMKEATAEYLAENDELGEFLYDETEPGTGIGSTALYARYCEWCRIRNTQPKKLPTFSQEIGKKHTKEKKRSGYVFAGIKFKERDGEVDVI